MSDDSKNDSKTPELELLDTAIARHDPECPVAQVLTSVRDQLSGGDGPAQVATPAYRNNFDSIFGKKQVVGQA